MLGTAIRKGNRVGSFSITGTITSLSSVESSLGVVISNCVGVSVRRDFIRISWLSMISRGMMDNWGVVGRGSMNNRGMVDYWGVVDNRGVVDSRDMISRGSMDNRGGMISRGMVDNRGMVSRSSMDSMVNNRGSVVSSTSNRFVSTKCWLDLRKSLRVVYLRDGGMGSSESF